MAEIEIEPRRRGGSWKWVVVVLIVAAVAAGAWWLLSGDERTPTPSTPEGELMELPEPGRDPDPGTAPDPLADTALDARMETPRVQAAAGPPANRLYSHANTAQPMAPSTRA